MEIHNDEKQVLELATKEYGYCGLFSRRETIQEVQDYIEKFPASDRAGLYTVMGLTLNTIAYNLAKAELEAEA
jgi:hypothetical protein